MRRIFAAFAIGLIAGLSQQALALSPEEVARAVDPSVVRIYLEGSRGKGSGTGFVVSQNDHVATNFHVVQPHLERGWAIYAYVCRLLPLTCLAPDIVEAIFDGRQPKGLRSCLERSQAIQGSLLQANRSEPALCRPHLRPAPAADLSRG